MTTPILPQPPKKTDPQFDEWMFRMWKTLLGAAGGAAVWNQADKGAGLVLSGGGLAAAEAAGTWYMVRATKGLRRGKWFWEITATDASALVFGVTNASAALTKYVGQDANGWGYIAASGLKVTNATTAAYGNTIAAGDVVGVALDMDGGNLYFYKNGTIQNTGTAAYTGLTGTLYPSVSCQSGTATANFGQIPFVYAVPDGYNAGVI